MGTHPRALLLEKNESLMCFAVWRMSGQCAKPFMIIVKRVTLNKCCIAWKTNDPELPSIALYWPLQSETRKQLLLTALRGNNSIQAGYPC